MGTSKLVLGKLVLKSRFLVWEWVQVAAFGIELQRPWRFFFSKRNITFVVSISAATTCHNDQNKTKNYVFWFIHVQRMICCCVFALFLTTNCNKTTWIGCAKKEWHFDLYFLWEMQKSDFVTFKMCLPEGQTNYYYTL